MATSLINWMRRNAPAKVRIRTEEGEERTIEVGEKGNRWRAATDACESCRAVHIEALNKEGGIIATLEHEPAEVVAEEDAQDKRDKARATERKAIVSEIAQVIRENGVGYKECFAAGVESMRTALECIIEQNKVSQGLVTALANHLTVALTNVHNLSALYANAIQEAASGGDDGKSEQGELIAAVLTRALAGPMMNGSAAATPQGGKKP